MRKEGLYGNWGVAVLDLTGLLARCISSIPKQADYRSHRG